MAMNQLYRTVTGQSQQSGDPSEPQPPPLGRTTTTDPLTGTLNHLSQHQHDLLDQFKERLQKEGWWKPDGMNGKPTHDDGTLLRYLRARKFEIDGAVGQFSETEKWMKEQRVEELYEHFDVDFYEKARVLYPQWTGHRDKRGIPLYVYEIKGLDSKAVSRYQKDSEAYKKSLPFHKTLSTPAKLLPLFALYHNLLNFVLPMCSTMERPNPEIPVTNSTNIVDISNVGLSQFWNLKQHMQDASVLATAHYPETLDRIFIIGAPSFFPTVWGWVKRWFDPVTVSKIFILGKHEVIPTLTKFIEMDHIPQKYGGKLDWKWGDLPHMGPEEMAAVQKDGKKGWIGGPCLWLEHERVVVGSDHGKPRRSDKEIAQMKPVVYAADYTEIPVHEGRKSVSSPRANGRAIDHAPTRHSISGAHAPAPRPSTPKAAPAPAPAPAMAPAPVQSHHAVGPNVRQSPMGDSQVNLPTNQPAHPATTAEYISPVSSSVASPVQSHQPSTATLPYRPQTPVRAAPASAPAPAPAPAHVSTHRSPRAVQVHPHPPSQPQPGPLSAYQIEMQKAIASKMDGESVSVIPGTNGSHGEIAHPDIVITSDGSKGLAVEAEKLAFGQQQLNGKAGRPGMERFVTAQGF